VSGARVVCLEITGDLQPRFQHLGLLLVKALLVLRQQVAQLASRDLDPEFVQWLQQQRLGHVLMMMLVQHVAH
jgi:hypothetical protein